MLVDEESEETVIANHGRVYISRVATFFPYHFEVGFYIDMLALVYIAISSRQDDEQSRDALAKERQAGLVRGS